MRDQGAMVRQLGYTPEQFARYLIDKEGGKSKAIKVFNRSSDKKSEYTPVKVNEVSSGYIYSNILKKIFYNDYHFEDYDRAASLFWPSNKVGNGSEDIIKYWSSLKNIFSEKKFTIEHVASLDEKNNNQKATIRWFLSGKHSKDSEEFGKKTDKDLFIMGINHAELRDDKIIREWVLFDEVAIWKQILM